MAATPIPPILDQDRYVRYEPAALTTEFDVPFPYFGSDASELLVLVDGVKVPAFTVLSRSVGALASAVKPVEDAFVRLSTGVAGVTVEIYGNIRPRRTVQATAAFSTRDFNFVFSYLIAALREMWSQFTRAVQVPPGETTVILPAATERAGKVLAFGSDGTPQALEPASAGLVDTPSIVDHAVTRPKLGPDVVAELDGKQAAAEVLAGIAALGPSLAAGDLIRATGPNAVERIPSTAVGSAVDIAMLAMELADLKNSTILAAGWWAESYDTTTTLVLPDAVGPRLTGIATAPLGGTAANFNDGSTSTVWSAAIGNFTGSTDINARIAAKLDFGAAIDIARVDLSGWYTSNAAYAGTYWGLYTSTDGTTWTLYGAAIPITGSPASVSRSVAVNARYVAVAAYAANVGDTVYISELAVYPPRAGGVSSNIDLTEPGVIKPTMTDTGSVALTATVNAASGGNAESSNATHIPLAVKIPNGATVTAIGVYSVNVQTACKVKVFRRNAAGNFSLVAEQTFSHVGGGTWQDVALTTPYVVPATGDHYVGFSWFTAWMGRTGDGVPGAYAAGDVTGANQTLTEFSAGVTVPMRFTANVPVGGIDGYTKLMLHMDGADNGVVFTDSSATPKTVTASGNAKTSTTSPKFGSASLLLDGAGDYITAASHPDFNAGSGDFTIDWWFKFAAVPSDATWRSFFGWNSNNFACGMQNGYFVVSYGSNNLIQNNGLGWVADTWYHMALVRSAGTTTVYRNGVSIGTCAVGTLSAADITIGSNHNGRIDAFRVSIGVARWTAAFTPPVAPYAPTVANNLDARFIGQDIGAVPATATVYALLQPIDAVTPAADLRLYATRDAGATWSPAATVEELGAVGALKLIRGVVDLSGQPAGQALAPRIVSTGNKSFKLHGHYIAGRAA